MAPKHAELWEWHAQPHQRGAPSWFSDHLEKPNKCDWVCKVQRTEQTCQLPLNDKTVDTWTQGVGPEDTAIQACWAPYLPGLATAPASISGDPKSSAAWLLGQESELPHSTAHKSVQVPTGSAEDRVIATQKKEGHGTKDKVCQLHAIPKEVKETKMNIPNCSQWCRTQCVGHSQRDLALSITREKNEPRTSPTPTP